MADENHAPQTNNAQAGNTLTKADGAEPSRTAGRPPRPPRRPRAIMLGLMLIGALVCGPFLAANLIPTALWSALRTPGPQGKGARESAAAPADAATARASDPQDNVISPQSPSGRPPSPVLEARGPVLISVAAETAPLDVAHAHETALEDMICDADYPSDFDAWHRLDLNGDGTAEQLVFFTLEGFGGGNYYLRYLNIYRYVETTWLLHQSMVVGGERRQRG